MTEHRHAAAAARLHYVCDDRPGIRREMGPLGFKYVDAKGRIIRKAAELKRIRALAIPPAWTEVWICGDPRGHIQATGRDARGRKQYRYHPAWRVRRDETKFDRLQQFAAAIPKIRARTTADLARPGLPRKKVLAAVVQLLEKSLIRVGNDEYARQNRSFGLTTLQDRHVTIRGSRVRFAFRGKSGKRHRIEIDDRRLARIVSQCRDLPGQELFQYVDAHGRRQDVSSSDVNAYLREVAGEAFTAKDFRTWAGSVLAALALCDCAPARSQTQAKKDVLQAIDAVAGVLGNTRAVCRKSYVHPAVLDAYADGTLAATFARRTSGLRRAGGLRRAASLRPEEAALLALLQRRVTARAA